jgi:hypothetical protein
MSTCKKAVGLANTRISTDYAQKNSRSLFKAPRILPIISKEYLKCAPN